MLLWLPVNAPRASTASTAKYAFQVTLQSQQQMVRAAFGHSRVQVLTAVIGELATSEGYPRLARSIVSSISWSERQQCKLRQPALPIDDSSRGKWTVTRPRRKGGPFAKAQPLSRVRRCHFRTEHDH